VLVTGAAAAEAAIATVAARLCLLIPSAMSFCPVRRAALLMPFAGRNDHVTAGVASGDAPLQRLYLMITGSATEHNYRDDSVELARRLLAARKAPRTRPIRG